MWSMMVWIALIASRLSLGFCFMLLERLFGVTDVLLRFGLISPVNFELILENES
jgi:hypothetical protein